MTFASRCSVMEIIKTYIDTYLIATISPFKIPPQPVRRSKDIVLTEASTQRPCIRAFRLSNRGFAPRTLPLQSCSKG